MAAGGGLRVPLVGRGRSFSQSSQGGRSRPGPDVGACVPRAVCRAGAGRRLQTR